jgi:hypothetical protein
LGNRQHKGKNESGYPGSIDQVCSSQPFWHHCHPLSTDKILPQAGGGGKKQEKVPIRRYQHLMGKTKTIPRTGLLSIPILALSYPKRKGKS